MVTHRKDRVWIVVGVLASIAVMALSWFFFINPQLNTRATAEQQTADAQMQNLALHQKIDKLRRDSANSAALQAQLDDARDALPTDHRLDAFTRQLTAQAQKAGVTVMSITPASPVLLQTQPTAGPTSDDAAAGEADATGTAPPAAAPTTAPKTTGPAGQLYAIQVTLITDGTVAKQQALLQAIQTEGPRAALVLSTKMAPDQATAAAPAAPAAPTAPTSGTGKATGTPQTLVDTWTMTTVLQVFVAPQSPQDQAALATLAAQPSK
jgi:hypothetical protein